MNRLLLTALLVFIVFSLLRARRRPPPRSERPGAGGPGRTERGAPRALVCGDCGTQFAPEQQGWACPKCGK